MSMRRALCGGGSNDNTLMRIVLWIVIGFVAWLLTAAAATTPVCAAERVASVEYSKGAVSALDPQGSPRLIARGSELFTGDLIETASQSFAIVKFDDGTLMTLRPGTQFRIDDFKPQQSSGQALFRLLKGGFRVLTGFISKSSDGVFRVDTPVATIGVRGTEFDARLCESASCQEVVGAVSQDATSAIAVVAQMQGTVNIETNDLRQAASPGSSVPQAAVVKTAEESWALLVFRDGSRITVEPDTEVEIAEFQYSAEEPDSNNFVMRLMVGGLRALTGAIARLNPAGYRIETPSSNIGVRGTGFDLNVQNTVALHVWDSCVDFSSATGTLPVCADQNAIQQEPDAVPELTDSLPPALRSMSGPRPDSADLDENTAQLLGALDSRLYVTVTEGRVDLANEGDSVVLGPSQNAVALPEGEIQIIEEIPDSMRNDAMPRPGEVNDRLLGLFDLVQGGVARTTNSRSSASSTGNEENPGNADDAGNDSDQPGNDDNSGDSAGENSGSNGEASAEVVPIDRESSESSGEPGPDLVPMECAVQ